MFLYLLTEMNHILTVLTQLLNVTKTQLDISFLSNTECLEKSKNSVHPLYLIKELNCYLVKPPINLYLLLIQFVKLV